MGEVGRRKNPSQQGIEAMEHDPAPPRRERERLIGLSLAIALPPVFWALQVLVLSAFTNWACFPAFTVLPAPRPDMAWVRVLEFGGDALAILVAAASGWIALSYFRLAQERIAIYGDALSLWRLDRLCFMSLGAMLSSGGFFIAIVFETIASLMVAPCG